MLGIYPSIHLRVRAISATFLAGWLAAAAARTQPAFPGGEGFGAKATGGRGGPVLRVTTLAADGPGSLQWALDQPGPRIVVFRVSGVIDTSESDGTIDIPHGDVTIAGQTAPGAGSTIHGRLVGDFDPDFSNVIVRHLRVRPPIDAATPSQLDAIQFGRRHTIEIRDRAVETVGAKGTIDAKTVNRRSRAGREAQLPSVSHPVISQLSLQIASSLFVITLVMATDAKQPLGLRKQEYPGKTSTK